MEIQDYIKAGKIAGEVRENIRKKNWIGKTVYEICEEVENEIRKTNLTKSVDLDITLETAPTWDLLNQFLNEVAIPISDMSHSYMKYKYPKLIKFMKWKFRNRLDKIRKVWLSNELTGANFAKFKSYRLFLYEK